MRVLNRLTIFFERTSSFAQTWPRTINNLIDMKSRYNHAKGLFEKTNN
jgi:hypothetical protein